MLRPSQRPGPNLPRPVPRGVCSAVADGPRGGTVARLRHERLLGLQPPKCHQSLYVLGAEQRHRARAGDKNAEVVTRRRRLRDAFVGQGGCLVDGKNPAFCQPCRSFAEMCHHDLEKCQIFLSCLRLSMCIFHSKYVFRMFSRTLWYSKTKYCVFFVSGWRRGLGTSDGRNPPS